MMEDEVHLLKSAELDDVQDYYLMMGLCLLLVGLYFRKHPVLQKQLNLYLI
jgi:hypothetical protein